MMTIHRILLIDDDADDRDFFREAIAELQPGIQVIQAVNGQEALDLLRRSFMPCPDLIFLDINMPKVNGIQCLEKIRQMPAYTSVPVIMYSTTIEMEKEKALSCGASYVFRKKAFFRELQNELSAVFARFANPEKVVRDVTG